MTKFEVGDIIAGRGHLRSGSWEKYSYEVVSILPPSNHAYKNITIYQLKSCFYGDILAISQLFVEDGYELTPKFAKVKRFKIDMEKLLNG